MKFDDIVKNKAILDKALRAFNENVQTKILLEVDDKKIPLMWTNQRDVEITIEETCGKDILKLLKDHDFDFSLAQWHTGCITYIKGVEKPIRVVISISID